VPFLRSLAVRTPRARELRESDFTWGEASCIIPVCVKPTIKRMDLTASLAGGSAGRSALAWGLVVVWLPVLAAGSVWAAEAPGWQSLFDGRTLDGWTVSAPEADRQAGFWKVADGAIECNSLGRRKHDYVWLVSDREYTNFHLRLEFQVFKSSPGNSGIQFRSRVVEGTMMGPQVDIHPPTPLRTGLIYDETKGVNRWICPSLTNWTMVPEKAPAAARETVLKYADNDPSVWNTLELVVDGMHIQTQVNGRAVADFDGTGILDDRVHRDQQVGTSGRLALQLHRGDELKIRYRGLLVRELSRR
jgi:hypothetical protein